MSEPAAAVAGGGGRREETAASTFLSTLSSLPVPQDEEPTSILEFVWIQRTSSANAPSQMMRSKTRVVSWQVNSLTDVPDWSADAYSTAQGEKWLGRGLAEGRDPFTREILLRPARLYRDPFRGKHCWIVLCEAVYADGSAPASNHRAALRASIETLTQSGALFAFEQESLVLQEDGKSPLGWPPGGVPVEQILFLNYCSSGNGIGRDILEAHLRSCLYSGIVTSGVNLEVLVGALEIQIGPADPLRAADDLWMARYLLARITEGAGLKLTFDPMPVPNMDGLGLHVNFSTTATHADAKARAAPSQSAGAPLPPALTDCVRRLDARHKEHIAVYGPGNERRLKGGAEYSSIDTFTFGVGDRSASVRIAFNLEYLEDRRPASNADPYLIILAYAQTMGEEGAKKVLEKEKEDQARSSAAAAAAGSLLPPAAAGAGERTGEKEDQGMAPPSQRSADRAASGPSLRAPAPGLVSQLSSVARQGQREVTEGRRVPQDPAAE